MEGPDHGVGPMPLGLRSPGEDQDARYQTPHCRHQQDQPPGPRVSDGMRLTFERGRHVKMQQAPEDHAVHGLKAEQECHGAQSGDEPDDGAAQGGPSESRRCPEGSESLEALP